MLEYKRVMAEIDLDAAAHNMREIRKITESKIMAVVKADAYGHGAVELAKVFLYNGADMLGVATLEEAKQLRENNIFVPVLILGYTPQPLLLDIFKYRLTQTVFSYETAAALSKIGEQLNEKCKIHIKIDTGMGRLGFLPDDRGIEDIRKISGLPFIEAEGVYTHFATADESDTAYTKLQLERFRKITSKVCVPFRHAANSAGILNFEEAHFNLVRAGIILYGIFPSEHVKRKISLMPVMSIKTHVSNIKVCPAGTYIGYGRTFKTETESVIATVPVGYADGYLRGLSGKAKVMIKGKYAPVCGNICMDQFMADVTDIPGIMPGDDVILMSGNKGASADELAKYLHTIPYEILCSIGKRVPRVYKKSGMVLKTVEYV